jgi:hypothetical protein
MGNSRKREQRRKSKKKQSAAQKAHILSLSKSRPVLTEVTNTRILKTRSTPKKPLSTTSPCLEDVLAQNKLLMDENRRLLDGNKVLVDENKVLKTSWESEKRKTRRHRVMMKVRDAKLAAALDGIRKERKAQTLAETRIKNLEKRMDGIQQELIESIADAKRIGRVRAEERQEFRRVIHAFLKQIKRAKAFKACIKVAATARKPVWRARGAHRAYSNELRVLAREMVDANTRPGKVGDLIYKCARAFGVELNKRDIMSRRSVGRSINEGGVAAKLQLGYELLKTSGKNLL